MKNKNTWLYFTLGSAFLWSLFPIISSDALKITPPFLTLSITLLIASLFFFILVIVNGKFHELRHIGTWRYATITAIFIGVLHYGFYYSGLRMTSPGNAGLVGLTEIGFSFLLFQVWKKESLTKIHIIGILLLIIGAIYLLIPKTGKWNYGDILICLAMAFAPIGNNYQQKGRKYISAFPFLFMRCLISSIFLLGMMYVMGEKYIVTDVQKSLPFLLINGVVLMGISKIFWLEAINRITVTRVLAIHGFVPMLTILLLWIFRGTEPSIQQIISGIPMIIGVYFLSKK